MSKETELSDKAIKDIHQYHYGVERYLKFARAVIAADRELRRGDDQDLAQLHANGAKSWADVPDATAWVDELRGDAAGTTERIRANHLPDDGGMISEAALSHAINQATCSIADATEAGLIRAVSKAIWRQMQAQQSAPAQPVALPAGMPEPVAWIAEYGGDVYTAAQVQAMLSQGLSTFDEVWDGIDWDVWRMQSIRELVRHIHSRTAPQPLVAAVERKPLTPAQRAGILKSVGYEGHDGWEVDWDDVIDAVEKFHGITAVQPDTAKGGQHGAE